MCEHYPYIPRAFLDFSSERLTDACAEIGHETVYSRINESFQKCCVATRLDPDQLLVALSFDPRNQDKYNFQSMFGVMRTAVTLHNKGFVNITPLPARPERKEADLLASKGSVLFAVEVFRANEDEWRVPGSNFEDYIARRYLRDKKAQLDATIAAHRCVYAILAVVFDSGSKHFLATEDLEAAMQPAFAAMGSPAATHLLLFTGLQGSSGPEDEVFFYPSLPD